MKEMGTTESIEDTWKLFREHMTNILEEHIVTNKHKGQQWMAEEILNQA